MHKTYDVVVVGGGTAGVIAALQSAKAGVKTLLIEKTEMLGGTITNARVFAPGLFHAWGKQVVGGLGWELVKKCVEENGDSLPDFSNWDIKRHWTGQIGLNVFLYAMLCDEALKQAGCDVLFHTVCAKLEEKKNEKILTVCTKEGLKKIVCKALIDCTGDANVASLAGYETERSENPQPSTYICRIDGYDLTSVDLQAVEKAYDEEVKKGNLFYTDLSWNVNAFDAKWLRNHGDNANHVAILSNPESSEGRSKIAIEGRLALLRLYRFFRKQKGFENLRFTYLAPECGVRESVRIIGKSKIALADFLSGKVYDDAVCYGFYPVDLHTLSGEGLENVYFEEGVVPTIPRSAMLPKNSKNFLVAGRCISMEQSVSSSLRVEASCMAMGQAAGAMAALAVIENKDVEEIEMETIYQLLEKNKGIIPKKI